MILTLESSLRAVFTIYGLFWAVVIVGLFFGIGALMKRRERAGGDRERKPGGKH